MDTMQIKDSVVFTYDGNSTAAKESLERLESERDAKIAKYRDEVKAKYAAIIKQIKTCGLDPEKYEKNPRGKDPEKAPQIAPRGG